MRTIIAVVVSMIGLANPGQAAEEKADARAVDYCKSTSGTFVAIAKCLPDAHVALKTMDAFETIYPASAQPLRLKCIERNEGNVVGAATCLTEAINAAIGLKASLPKGSNLDDAIFESVSDTTLKTRLDDAEEQAKAVFPNVRVWGGTMYKAYQ